MVPVKQTAPTQSTLPHLIPVSIENSRRDDIKDTQSSDGRLYRYRNWKPTYCRNKED